MGESSNLWGGRFAGGPSLALENLSRSTQFDWRLFPYDIAGSKAHAKALASAGLLTADELKEMTAGLSALFDDCTSGQFVAEPSDEDVHSALERGLIEKVGPELGGKLRAGRSRNDQIATFVRMFISDNAIEVADLTRGLLGALLEQAEKHVADPMPGRTHMQSAQPVTLGHHLMAHFWALTRDLERLESLAQLVMQRCPYGSGALAGSTLGLDASLVAEELGFGEPEYNSIDATASRDFVAEFSFNLSMLAVNISRLAEEIIIWNTAEFNFVKLDDAFSTGSSIMPQKKNPDICELARGKAGRLIGDLAGLLSTLKGLPLAYNRDLQEDKEPIFDAVDQLCVLLPAFAGQVATLTFNTARMLELSDKGFSLATDIAEWLVKRGVPFKNAHDLSGACVALAEGRGVELNDLGDADFVEAFKGFVAAADAARVREVLTVSGSINARDNQMGTAPARVLEQIKLGKEILK